MTKDELRITLSGPCGDNYDLRDGLTDLLHDLYARLFAAEARVAALESPAPSDPAATDASAAMDGWEAIQTNAVYSPKQIYLRAFADGVNRGRHGKQPTPDDLDAAEAKAWAAYGGGDDRQTFSYAYRAGWIARGRK